jgi:hypothetical protein
MRVKKMTNKPDGRWIKAAFSRADDYADRLVNRTDGVNGIDVSTSYTTDFGFETALIDANGAHPVERYEYKGSAAEGHLKWVELAKAVKTVVELGTQDRVIEDKRITLVRMI